MSLFLNNDDGIQILGKQWNLMCDYSCFSALEHKEDNRYFERDIFLEVAKVFDLLSLFTLCSVFMKMLLQDLWTFSLTCE